MKISFQCRKKLPKFEGICSFSGPNQYDIVQQYKRWTVFGNGVENLEVPAEVGIPCFHHDCVHLRTLNTSLTDTIP